MGDTLIVTDEERAPGVAPLAPSRGLGPAITAVLAAMDSIPANSGLRIVLDSHPEGRCSVEIARIVQGPQSGSQPMMMMSPYAERISLEGDGRDVFNALLALRDVAR